MHFYKQRYNFFKYYVWYTTDFILHCMFSFVFQDLQIWFLMLIFIFELFLVNDEAAQKTILSRRCFWASTFMTLTTEIIKWLYKSKGYDSLFILRFNINRKSYRCLATCFCSFLINVKEIVIAYSPSCHSKPVRCYFLVFLQSLSINLQLQPTVCSPTLVFLAVSSARMCCFFCFITSENFGCQYKHSLSRMIIYYSDTQFILLLKHRSAHCIWTEIWKLIHSFTDWKWHCLILLIPYSIFIETSMLIKNDVLQISLYTNVKMFLFSVHQHCIKICFKYMLYSSLCSC